VVRSTAKEKQGFMSSNLACFLRACANDVDEYESHMRLSQCKPLRREDLNPIHVN
jgi:hypothetical protein